MYHYKNNTICFSSVRIENVLAVYHIYIYLITTHIYAAERPRNSTLFRLLLHVHVFSDDKYPYKDVNAVPNVRFIYFN